MSYARYLIGDTRAVVATLPDASVDLVLTSPPFLALRSYLPADHPDKDREIGSEATPAEFLDVLLELTAEWGRVLAPHGSIAVELGDTYAGTSARAVDAPQDEATSSMKYARVESDGRPPIRDMNGKVQGGGPGWPLDKCLVGVPHLYHLSLAYGRNILTGAESPAGRWRVRNVVAWCRPNPPVGALGDKFRPATSYITIATRARDRWFDLDAVRTKHDHKPHTDNRGEHRRDGIGGRTGQTMNPVDENGNRIQENPAGAPPLDWWEVPTEPYPGSHFATWPRRLLGRPIDAMCPRKVCTTCGQPRRRIVGDAEYVGADWASVEPHVWPSGIATSGAHSQKRDGGVTRVAPTLGWTDCGHDTWRRGVVLDPFGGSGTTGAVAVGMGRDAILIDLDERNADLAVQRIGMFCTVEDTRSPA